MIIVVVVGDMLSVYGDYVGDCTEDFPYYYKVLINSGNYNNNKK